MGVVELHNMLVSWKCDDCKTSYPSLYSSIADSLAAILTEEEWLFKVIDGKLFSWCKKCHEERKEPLPF